MKSFLAVIVRIFFFCLSLGFVFSCSGKKHNSGAVENQLVPDKTLEEVDYSRKVSLPQLKNVGIFRDGDLLLEFSADEVTFHLLNEKGSIEKSETFYYTTDTLRDYIIKKNNKRVIIRYNPLTLDGIALEHIGSSLDGALEKINQEIHKEDLSERILALTKEEMGYFPDSLNNSVVDLPVSEVFPWGNGMMYPEPSDGEILLHEGMYKHYLCLGESYSPPELLLPNFLMTIKDDLGNSYLKSAEELPLDNNPYERMVVVFNKHPKVKSKKIWCSYSYDGYESSPFEFSRNRNSFGASELGSSLTVVSDISTIFDKDHDILISGLTMEPNQKRELLIILKAKRYIPVAKITVTSNSENYFETIFHTGTQLEGVFYIVDKADYRAKSDYNDSTMAVYFFEVE